MKISLKVGKVEKEIAEAVIVFFFEKFHEDKEHDGVYKKLDSDLGGMLNDIVKNKEFEGKSDQISIIHTGRFLKTKRLILLGLGKKDEFYLDLIRRRAGNGLKRARDIGISKVVIAVTEKILQKFKAADVFQGIVEGAELALFKFDKLVSEKDNKKAIKELTLLLGSRQDFKEAQKGINAGEKISSAVNMSRELIIKPANFLTPTFLAEKAREIAKAFKLKCKVLSEREIKKLGMGAFLSVAKGSKEPPKFIIMDYHPAKAKANTIVVVGKGITFDSGGICLKPGKDEI